MTIATYDGLTAFVTDYLQLDSDTTAQLANLVRMAEMDLNRLALSPEREKVATAPTTAASQTVGLPADFRQLTTVTIDDDYALSRVSLALLQGSYTLPGKPTAFCITDGSLYLGPIPDSAYSLRITYMADLDPLSSAAQSNWLLAVNPDAYVYSLMAQCEAFRGNLEAGALWTQKLAGVIEDINRQGNRYRTGGPLRMVVG